MGVIVYRVCLYACMLVCVGGVLGARARMAYLCVCILYVYVYVYVYVYACMHVCMYVLVCII